MRRKKIGSNCLERVRAWLKLLIVSITILWSASCLSHTLANSMPALKPRGRDSWTKLHFCFIFQFHHNQMPLIDMGWVNRLVLHRLPQHSSMHTKSVRIYTEDLNSNWRKMPNEEICTWIWGTYPTIQEFLLKLSVCLKPSNRNWSVLWMQCNRGWHSELDDSLK